MTYHLSAKGGARKQRGSPRYEMILAKAGEPYARLVPLAAEPPRRQPGRFQGKVDDFGGGKLCHHRDGYLALGRRLQANGSPSARQRLRPASGRERRHVTHTNHEVSKAIAAEAVQLGASAIVIEDLTHIRKRIQACLRELPPTSRSWATETVPPGIFPP